MAEDTNTVLLREILKWIKISGLKEVKSLLDVQLQNDPKKHHVYHLSDGTKGAREIAAAAGIIAHSTVTGYWRDWANSGLGEMISVQRGDRFKRSFDLADFGIEVPVVKNTPAVQPTVQIDQEIVIQRAKEVEPNA